MSERERDEKEGEEEEPKGDSTTQKQDLWYHSITMQLEHIAVSHTGVQSKSNFHHAQPSATTT